MLLLQGYQGTALWFRLYNSFGYLNNVGYGGHLFPIFVGEIGSKFETSTDIQSLTDMQSWFLAKPNTGAAHNAVGHLDNGMGKRLIGLEVLA